MHKITHNRVAIELAECKLIIEAVRDTEQREILDTPIMHEYMCRKIVPVTWRNVKLKRHKSLNN